MFLLSDTAISPLDVVCVKAVETNQTNSNTHDKAKTILEVLRDSRRIINTILTTIRELRY